MTNYKMKLIKYKLIKSINKIVKYINDLLLDLRNKINRKEIPKNKNPKETIKSSILTNNTNP